MSIFVIKNRAPSPTELSEFRELVGWQNPKMATLIQSIKQSLFWVSAYCNDELIGFVRIVGDGAMYFYIQDLIVHPDYQGQGVGCLMMQDIEQYLSQTCSSGATIGLFAAQGREEFYSRFGYVERDGQSLGLGMCKFIK